MRVYTVQHKNVVNKLMKKGFYKTDRRFICEKSFSYAYLWMARMAKKYKGWWEPRPVWAWLKKPDLRSYRFYSNPKEPISRVDYLITLEIPEDEVLVSEFGLWHCVLNDFPVEANKEQEVFWKGLEDKKNNKKISVQDFNKRKENSWEQILFLKSSSFDHFEESFIGKIHLQATLPYIKKEWVVKVDPVKMKNTASGVNLKKS